MNLEFDPPAVEDLEFWARTNPKIVKRIRRLAVDCLRSPYDGLGKPEPLRHELSGCWSRRIDGKHRLVYRVEGESLVIMQARGHYRG